MKSSRQKKPPAASAELVVHAAVDVADDQIELGAVLSDDAGASQTLWFRFPRSAAPLLTRRADPFVIATALHALHRYRRLHVRGTVSDGLFANLAEFQAAFAAFHHLPFLDPVIYSTTETAAPAGPAHRASGITAFSGGVDSCFSVYRHTALSTLEPKRSLGAALMMHGFDIPLDQPAIFARSAERSRHLADDAGLRLFTGATNLRELPVPWEETFAAAVAGSLACFQSAFSFGLVPSFQEWSQARFDHGSNPLTDPLLSSPSFQIVHDGAGFGRIEKLRQLAGWPGAMQHLRVCWQGDELDRNCCVCEKCLRTMLMLDVCGVDRPKAFPKAIDQQAVETLVIKNQSGLDEFGYLIAEAHRLGLHPLWLKPAERMLRRNVRNRRLWQRGQSLADLIPPGLRRVLRKAGHRWLWKTPAAPMSAVTPPTAASLAAR
jgi:hypothetical protein